MLKTNSEKEKPYVSIDKEMIRNSNLIPDSRWFIAYLMSFSPKKIFSIDQIKKDQGLTSKDLSNILADLLEFDLISVEGDEICLI